MSIDFPGLGRANNGPDPQYADSLADAPPGELVALHVDADSYDPVRARPTAVAALRIAGHRIVTSQPLLLDATQLADQADAADQLIRFIGGRPLVGFYLEFGLGLLDRLVQPVLGAALGNERIEVSSLYYESRGHFVPGKNAVDLRLSSILEEMDLPGQAGDAWDNALASAMIYLRLRFAARG